MLEYNKIINADCLDVLKTLPDKCIDMILTDPPYLYLDVDFDKEGFDERAIFTELARVLKDTGFIVFSSRGDSFYRWNLLLAELGLPFREEIIWNKKTGTSPCHAIHRIHETISIRGKQRYNKHLGAKFNKVKIDYIINKIENNDINSVINMLKDILIHINNEYMKKYITTGVADYLKNRKKKPVTVRQNIKNTAGYISSAKTILSGGV